MNKSPCDILIRNGQVVTMDAARAIFRPGAVAITGSRILEVGADADLRQRHDAGGNNRCRRRCRPSRPSLTRTITLCIPPVGEYLITSMM